MRNLHVKLLALALTAFGLTLCWYKVTRLGLPLLPTEKAEVWTVEARIEFKARRNAPVKVQFFIPRQPAGYTVVDENFVASNYGLTTEDDGSRRSAQWAVRKVTGYQVLYYRIHLARDPSPCCPRGTAGARDPAPDFPELMRSAATALMDDVRNKSADSGTFARELLTRLNAPMPDANVILLRQDIQSPEDWVRRLVKLLAVANIPARPVHLLLLRDGISHGSLTPWLEVYDGRQWLPFNPQTGEAGLPKDALVWHIGDEPILQIEEAKTARSNIPSPSAPRIEPSWPSNGRGKWAPGSWNTPSLACR